MTHPLIERLATKLAATAAAPLCIAYSGGPDSTALLHAFAALPEARRRGLRAIHVDHGLHGDSATWAGHCRALCATLDVPLVVAGVVVDRSRGDGIESAARRARYAAFAETMRAGERIALAHHRDDQAETVLMKLLRGAGPEGLAGMREHRPFAGGELWRPLLGTPRTVLLDYVRANDLHTIDDPSNADTALARGYLRDTVLPALHRHWPHAVDSITHSAGLCADAADLLTRQWKVALDELHDAGTGSLDARGWLALPTAWRVPLLDHWLHAAGLAAPTTAQRVQLERQIAQAGAERLPLVRWPHTEVRVWRGRIWAMPPEPEVDTLWEQTWQGEPLALPGRGSLRLDGGRLAAPLTVRLRRGGEHLRPRGDRHTRELRDLFQQAAMPPWLRPRCPLIYEGNDLVAVADRWVSERGETLFTEAGGRPQWSRAD
ncbi:MAG TPA: tRNA lysidine(34) synthetase TilS [Luteibacter sp.]|nr:tRNA lysidine(34) synthetase TilS [Luteibacter sp.]